VTDPDESSLSKALEAKLNDTPYSGGEPRVIEATAGNVRVRAEVVDVDRLGVVVERLRVEAGLGDTIRRAQRVEATLRPAGQRLQAVEVDERLGGGVLRTSADHMMGGRFYQVDLDTEGAELTRHKKNENGRRTRERFTLTREHLGKLVDDLSEVLGD